VRPHEAGNECLKVLRRDRHGAAWTELRPEFDVEQAQEMMDFGERRDRTLAAPSTRSLLNGDRGRDSENMIDVGPGRGLDELARVRVQALQVAALALAEHNIEGQGAFTRARRARDHREGPALDIDVDIFEVVLSRSVDHDGAASAFAQAGL
jgi:hypothetical protein